MKKDLKGTLLGIAAVALLCAAFFAAVWGWILHYDTLSPLWIGLLVGFAGGGLGIGATLFVAGSKGLTVKPLTGVAVFLFCGAMSFATLYVANYYTAQGREQDTMTVHIDKKEHYVKYVSNRVGRRGVSHGRRRVNVYEVTIAFPDNTQRTIEVNSKLYKKLYKNRDYELPVVRGCFGMKVILKNEMTLIGPEPKRTTPRRRHHVRPPIIPNHGKP